MDKLYQRIIFATDLGPQSLYIANHAVKLSRLCQASLIALHVVEPPMTYTVQFHERDENLKAATDNAAVSLKALCEKLASPEIVQIIQVGAPQDQILALSIQHDCDLIIVGSHGVGGYSHALGSTAHHLQNESHCDLLTVQVRHLQKVIGNQAPSGRYLWQLLDENKIANTSSRKDPTYGSAHGFGEQVHSGPRLSPRPPGAPYRGGSRKDKTDKDEDKEK